MAIFSASLRTLSRTRGDSAVAAAAYRAGLAVRDERLGVVHDYNRRAGVERVRILVPGGAPGWASEAAKLWNAAEAAEARRNSRVARELIVALPHELGADSRASLAEDIGRVLVDRYGAAAMVAIHAPDGRGDQRNHHCHILFSTRVLGAEGFGAKIRVLDDRAKGPEEVEALRRTVADLTNNYLAAAGVPERVDHRTLSVQAREAEARGHYGKAAELTREPTVHLGRAGTALARRGGPDERAALNAALAASNRAALAAYVERKARPELSSIRSPVAKAPRAGQSQRSVRLRPTATAPTALGGPFRVARATGRDAELLNAQAALTEEGGRVASEAQAYLDGLRRSMEQNAVLVDAYLAVMGRPTERPRLLEQCARDPAWVERLRRSLEARAELQALDEELPRRRREYGQAMVATTKAQQAVEKVEAARPSAWRVLSRRQWAEKRRNERARLGLLQGQERAARLRAAGSSANALKERAWALREEIRGIEKERRRATQRALIDAPRAVDGAVVEPPGRPQAGRSSSRRLTP